ncbi:DUF4760 domain-containing protein [Roseospira goensis]|uniref:DUF4760 domain-containing protein n=1 Tax=Roseospira goensis TaxID=391922 RepID=A0A7W6WL27_9PROT|nr:DUF4760 domain-containing protein [Roseospira goensis]MBB4286981.1 hypothetical protein [Roseospira goensis]
MIDGTVTYEVFIGLAQLIVLAVGLLFTIISLWQNYRVNKHSYEWNKKKYAQDALGLYKNSVILTELQKDLKYIEEPRTISVEELENHLDRNDSLREQLHALLNYYEGLARGIHTGIYDETVIRSGREGAMKRAFKAFEPYILCRRYRNNSPNAWIELEKICKKWEQR